MVGQISHELRTPLNGLRILLHVARQYNDLPQEFIDLYLTPALHSSDYLLNLINDILDYTEINFQKNLRMIFEPV